MPSVDRPRSHKANRACSGSAMDASSICVPMRGIISIRCVPCARGGYLGDCKLTCCTLGLNFTLKKTCTYTHPPGRKVYQRGAHIIWEVDGAEAKVRPAPTPLSSLNAY